jgi:fused signal recognition particle receptor
MGLFDFFSKPKKETLDKGLEKTKTSFLSKVARTIVGKSKVDEEVLDELEEVLISSDVGVETTLKIIDKIESRVKKDKVLGTEELQNILKEEIANLLEEKKADFNSSSNYDESNEPYVIMVVGVNGVGKTTTIGKLAHQFKAALHD